VWEMILITITNKLKNNIINKIKIVKYRESSLCHRVAYIRVSASHNRKWLTVESTKRQIKNILSFEHPELPAPTAKCRTTDTTCQPRTLRTSLVSQAQLAPQAQMQL